MFSMLTNLPPELARHPLAQTEDRRKQRIGVFALKLRESFKTYLNDTEHWQPSYCTEPIVDTFFDDTTRSEISELQAWYAACSMQEQVHAVSYKITTEDKFIQNMMRPVDALPLRTEDNLEATKGKTAEFFETSVVYAWRKLVPRLSFQTLVTYHGTYSREIPLADMDDSCMLQWCIKNHRPYQIFVSTPNEFLDVTRRMKTSVVTHSSGRTSEVAQGGTTMRDSTTSGLGDQPPRPPRD